jgi:hypothetical protein
MITSRLSDPEPILNLKDLFQEDISEKEIEAKLNQLPRANMKLLEEIQTVLKRCTHLNDNQRLMYCDSQRYFMKQYLREMNKQR